MPPRGRSIDVTVVVASLLLGALLLVVEVRRGMHGPWLAVDAAAGVLACALLWWRTTRPLLVAGVMLPLAVVSFSSSPATLVSLYCVGDRRGTRATLVIGGCDLVAVVGGSLLSPQQGTPWWQTGLTVAVVIAATSAIGLYTGARRQLIDTLRDRADRAEEEQRREADRARSAERTRIAQEMHDVIAHRLALISLHAGALEVDEAARHHASVATAADFLQTTAQVALRELRDTIGVLRGDDAAVPPSPPTAPQPTLADVGSLVADARTAGLLVEFRCLATQSEIDDLPGGIGRDVHRMVQEGLTNLAKHAPRCPASVSLAPGADGGLRLVIRNDLDRSATRRPGRGSGLTSLHERATRGGAAFRAGVEGTQFVVRADWPPGG